MLIALLACTGSDPVDSQPTDDSTAPTNDSATDDSGTDSGETLPDGLHGDLVKKIVPVPTFSALNQLGEARDSSALVGHPTVLWFYREAATAG